MLFLDTSQKMIHQIKQKMAELHIQNADTLYFDFEREDRSELKADYIFMAQVLLFYQGSKIFMGQDASMFVLDARK